ncbi:MAG: hypothetical protein JW776_08850 [Candidatus Lokiarchaeota archaeon]|nr:hypothetical protein [Candidatus Lokiarchaeota archaeon]
MSELTTWEGLLPAMPATILSLLNVEQPNFIPPPILPMIETFRDIRRITMVVIDNLGLFEITYYKPEFLIQNAAAFVLLSTKNPYTLGVFHQLLFGGFEPKGFHLLRKLNEAGLQTCFIGRPKDVNRYNGKTNTIPKDSDMSTWIEAAKSINKNSFTLLHFLDFENLHRQKRGSPEELIEKLIKRTDKWLLSLYKQMRSKTLMLVLGNHGRYRIDDISYSGKIAEWRKASVPIAVVAYKE